MEVSASHITKTALTHHKVISMKSLMLRAFAK